MTHPCRALRDPLKGAMLADRETRIRGILGLMASLANALVSKLE